MYIYKFQAEAFITLATALDQAGHHRQAQSIWQDAERVTASINHTAHDQAQALYWRHDQALAWRHLAKAFAKAHHWQEAERVLSSIAEWYWRERTSRSLAKAFAKAHLWQEAERITTSIPDDSYRMVAFRSLARDLAKAHQWQDAERIAVSITDASHQTIAFHHIAQCLAKAGDQVQAQNMQQAADKASASINLTSFSRGVGLEVFRDLVTALTQAHQWNKAERIASSFDHGSYRALALQKVAIAATKAGRHSQAQSLWREAEKITLSLENTFRIYGVSSLRDSSLYHLATDLIQARQWQEAERIVASIEYDAYQAMAFHNLATNLAQAHQWQEAKRVVSRISDASRRHCGA